MGRRSGCEGMDMSMITTLFCGDVSRTQMNLSDSIVTCVKVMNCWLIPRLVSVSASFIVMGALAVAMATEDNERDAQYKLSLSLAQSFDQEPRKEDPQETLTSGLRESSIDRWMGSIPNSYSNGREGKGKEENRKRLDVAAEKGNSSLSLSLLQLQPSSRYPLIMQD